MLAGPLHQLLAVGRTHLPPFGKAAPLASLPVGATRMQAVDPVKHPVASGFAVDEKTRRIILPPQLERLVSFFPVVVEEIRHHIHLVKRFLGRHAQHAGHEGVPQLDSVFDQLLPENPPRPFLAFSDNRQRLVG